MESNCRLGVCGSCRVKLISGKGLRESEDALEESDRKRCLLDPNYTSSKRLKRQNYAPSNCFSKNTLTSVATWPII